MSLVLMMILAELSNLLTHLGNLRTVLRVLFQIICLL